MLQAWVRWTQNELFVRVLCTLSQMLQQISNRPIRLRGRVVFEPFRNQQSVSCTDVVRRVSCTYPVRNGIMHCASTALVSARALLSWWCLSLVNVSAMCCQSDVRRCAAAVCVQGASSLAFVCSAAQAAVISCCLLLPACKRTVFSPEALPLCSPHLCVGAHAVARTDLQQQL